MRASLCAGGTLGAGMLYVERPADQDLPAALLRGEFCYVLGPRQMGKSSLRARCEQRLLREGVRCATVDLSLIGSKVTVGEWYFGLVEELCDTLALRQQAPAFWSAHQDMPPVQRLVRFLRDHVLEEIAGKVVIFVDEIDAVRALPFLADDFFAAIRSLYNQRADEPRYQRLCFCLLGVAVPGDLIGDAERTPFNIGRSIELYDFSPQEARAFLPCLVDAGGDAERLLALVLEYTSGHPYMTHRLCAALCKASGVRRPGEGEAQQVARAVEAVFLRSGAAYETNLAVADNFFRPDEGALPPERRAQMLRLYGRVLRGEPVAVDPADRVQAALRLTGMVAARSGRLQPRNRVFATAFDEDWVRALLRPMELAAPRRLRRTRAWLAAAGVGVVAIASAASWCGRRPAPAPLAPAAAPLKAAALPGLPALPSLPDMSVPPPYRPAPARALRPARRAPQPKSPRELRNEWIPLLD